MEAKKPSICGEDINVTEEPKSDAVLDREAILARIELLKERFKKEDFDVSSEEKAEKERLYLKASESCKELEAAKKAYKSEDGEYVRMQMELKESKERISKLGIFKGKEKKELEERIELLSKSIAEQEEKLPAMREKYYALVKIHEKDKNEAIEYEKGILERSYESYKKQIRELEESIAQVSMT